MNFSDALRQLLAGRRVRVNYWKRGTYLEIRDNDTWVREPTIFMFQKKSNGKDPQHEQWQWSPRQTDLLSTNWEEVS